MCNRLIFELGAVVLGLAVALGAFGAHGLQKMTDARGLANWETGVRYQVIHGLGLLILALAVTRYSAGASTAIAACFLAGIVIFSGSLYAIVLTGINKLGMITPIGGVLYIVGWAIAAVAHVKDVND